jgi:hypothetical protein
VIIGLDLNDFLFVKKEKGNNLNKSNYYWGYVKLFSILPSIGPGFPI